MRKYLLLALLCAITSPLAYAGGFNVYYASVRANGMVGAFTAMANDASTIYYNPAGLAKVEGISVVGGVSFVAPRTTFRNLTEEIAPYGAEANLVENTFGVPNIHVSYQITDGLTFGVNVNVPFGLGTQWESDWIGQNEAIESGILSVFVNPSVGYTLPDFGIGDLHVGVGLQAIVAGDVQLNQGVGNFSSVSGASEFNLEGDLVDPVFGFNFGILYEPADLIAIGFNYRSEMTPTFSGTTEYTNLPGELFSTTTGSTTLNFPASWNVGLNVEPMENLNILLDYVWWGWSTYEAIIIELDDPVAGFGGNQIVNNRDYEDTFQLRLGAEYGLGETVKGLTVRGGLAFDQNPIPDNRLDPSLPDTDRYVWSLGASYAVADFLNVDVAFSRILGQERRINGDNTEFNAIYNTNATMGSVGVTLNF